jgi:hypothetical protein
LWGRQNQFPVERKPSTTKDTKYHEGKTHKSAKRRTIACVVPVLVRGGLVVAGRAAGLTVHEAVAANADVERRLAEAAKFLALARIFRPIALGAAVFGRTGSGAHEVNVAQERAGWNMTEVMGSRDRKW